MLRGIALLLVAGTCWTFYAQAQDDTGGDYFGGGDGSDFGDSNGGCYGPCNVFDGSAAIPGFPTGISGGQDFNVSISNGTLTNQGVSLAPGPDMDFFGIAGAIEDLAKGEMPKVFGSFMSWSEELGKVVIDWEGIATGVAGYLIDPPAANVEPDPNIIPLNSPDRAIYCPTCPPYQEPMPNGGPLRVLPPGTISDATNAGSSPMNGLDANGNLIRVNDPSTLDYQLLELRREAARADQMVQDAQAALDAQRASMGAQQQAVDMALQDLQLAAGNMTIPWTSSSSGPDQGATRTVDPIEGTWSAVGSRGCEQDLSTVPELRSNGWNGTFTIMRQGAFAFGTSTQYGRGTGITKVGPGTYIAPSSGGWSGILLQLNGRTLQISGTYRYNGPLTGTRVCTMVITAQKS